MSPGAEERRGWMAVLARAPAEAIAARLAALPPLPPHERLRGPETGLVMLRGRAGGDGAPFNLGEATVTRCAARLEGAEAVGQAYVLGRESRRAELAAVLDAALQDPRRRADLLRAVVGPLAEAQAAAREARARKAAATRVRFVTLAAMR